jgi:lactate dehydrogenase-like 2-hydroxyacid dehydrogenase
MKPIRIVFLDAGTVGTTDNLAGLNKLGEIRYYDVTSREETIKHIGDAEIVITNKVIIDSHVMDSCPSVKLICVAATGMNNIDLVQAKSRGIRVKNVSGYSTESVVQVTFSLLLYLMNSIRYYDDYVKSGLYSSGSVFTHFAKNFHEISGKQFGIIGLGTIGKRVAEVATAFGAVVSYYSTSGQNLNNIYPHLPLSTLLAGSDVISIHCPLTPGTHNLIGYAQLRQMKRSSILLNLGRGGIVNEADLAKALNQNLIAGAGLDVHENEPPKPDNPLLHLDHPGKILMTPHLAWASNESRTRLVEGITDNIREYLRDLGIDVEK